MKLNEKRNPRAFLNDNILEEEKMKIQISKNETKRYKIKKSYLSQYLFVCCFTFFFFLKNFPYKGEIKEYQIPANNPNFSFDKS